MEAQASCKPPASSAEGDGYLSSQGAAHDEMDFEFLGNSSGDPYTVYTNVFAQEKGDKEQQFHLWFDPTAAFHTYTILWNPLRIIFLIDNIPIRVFNNNEAAGVPFPKSQPMRVYSSLWNADDWATQGGRVKTDWTKAPFAASYRKFNANAKIVGQNSVSTSSTNGDQAWQSQGIDAAGRNRIRWVQSRFMVYNYCTDLKHIFNVVNFFPNEMILFEQMLQELDEVALKRKRTRETLRVLQQAFRTLDELPLEAETVERGYSLNNNDPTGLPKIHGLPTSSFYSASSGSADSYTASPKNQRSRKSSHSGELQSPFYGNVESNGNGRSSLLGLYPIID